MSGVNKVILVGRLGTEPEVRSTQGGMQVCTLSLATSETWEKNGKREEKTEWHRVVLWGKLAELAQKYLKKGRMVYIEGKLQTRSWQDQQGQKRYTTEIVGNTMQFIDGGTSGGNRDMPDAPHSDDSQSNDSYYYSAGANTNDNQSSSSHSYTNSSRAAVDDDIPF